MNLKLPHLLIAIQVTLLVLGSAQLTQAVAQPSPASAADAGLKTHDSRYTIKLEDVLSIAFPLSPELNQSVTVQPDGSINVSGAPGIHVEGLTVPEVESVLKKDFRATLRDPIINVDLKDFQKPFFTVNGQVGKPGQYDLRSSITVAEAIAIAGGMGANANSKIYLFRRNSPSGYQVSQLDAKRIMNGSSHADNATIHPGDMIVVPESGLSKFKKYVPYSIGGYVNPLSY